MEVKNKYLQLEGIADKSVVKQLEADKNYRKNNTLWFFVDYSPCAFKKGITFDIILEGGKRMSKKFYSITLLNIVDEFGHDLPLIPEGNKTICRFEFKPNIPVVIQSLPYLLNWDYNKDSIKIARHQDLNFDSANINRNSYAIVFNEFLQLATETDSTNKKEFMLDILKIYEAHKQEFNEKMSPDIFSEVAKSLQA